MMLFFAVVNVSWQQHVDMHATHLGDVYMYDVYDNNSEIY